jgi:hypothetical protein
MHVRVCGQHATQHLLACCVHALQSHLNRLRSLLVDVLGLFIEKPIVEPLVPSTAPWCCMSSNGLGGTDLHTAAAVVD